MAWQIIWAHEGGLAQVVVIIEHARHGFDKDVSDDFLADDDESTLTDMREVLRSANRRLVLLSYRDSRWKSLPYNVLLALSHQAWTFLVVDNKKEESNVEVEWRRMTN